MSGSISSEDKVVAEWYANSYKCSECGAAWTDEWSCMCNDRCPHCNVETEPSSSLDLSRPLTSEDYMGAARLLSSVEAAEPAVMTEKDAKDYAEAMREGGERRFTIRRS
jgi:MoaA/NifB/PqqE/SkfB family radical SAM enzyme